MSLAPICLFAYNRPQHLRKTLDALQRNRLASRSSLHIFCDGPRQEATEENRERIREVQSLARNVNWPGEITVVARDENIGLAKSFVTGVSQLVGDAGKVIVLEDDMETSPGFLEFMNEALDVYAGVPEIMHISGYMYPQLLNPFQKRLPDTFALRVMACWGWATWQSAWSRYEGDAGKLLARLRERNLVGAFNLDGVTTSFEQQLVQNTENKISTWAIKWYASILLDGGLCLFPGRSLVRNIGNDGSGVHSGVAELYGHQRLAGHIHVRPVPATENREALRRVQWYYRFLDKEKNLAERIIEKLHLIR